MDRRARELSKLRLALSNFATHLNEFESRLDGIRMKPHAKHYNRLPTTNRSTAKQIVAAMRGGFDHRD